MKLSDLDIPNRLDISSEEVTLKPHVEDTILSNEDFVGVRVPESNDYHFKEVDLEQEPKLVKKKKVRALLSDSESDEDVEQTSSKTSPISEENSKSIYRALSNELLGGEPALQHGDNLNAGEKPVHKRKIKALKSDSEIDSEDEKIPSRAINEDSDEHSSDPSEILLSHPIQTEEKDNTQSYKSMFQNSDLYDAEGSSDEDSGHLDVLGANKKSGSQLDKSTDKAAKKKSVPQRKSKQSALEEIHSETQRLVRQSRVSLPYHQPKQRSLSEFLSRRKVPFIPLKTSSEQLSEVWQCIEEREKTAETFYRSESDVSEEESKKPLTNSNYSIKKLNDANDLSCSIEVQKMPGSLTNETEQTVTDTCNGQQDTTASQSTDGSSVNTTAKEGSHCLALGGSKNSVEKLDIRKSNGDETPLEYSESDSLKLSLTENTIFEISTTNSLEKMTGDLLIENEHAMEAETIFSDDKNKYISLRANGYESTETVVVPITNIESATEKLMFSASENLEKMVEPLKCKTSDKVETKKKITSLLHHSLLDIKLDRSPKISGSPDSFIDLDEGSEKPAALKLVTRFMKHAQLKPRLKKDQKVSVTITEVNAKGEVTSLTDEVLSIPFRENSKPGETRLQLKERLKEKIAQKREEEFVKRVEEYKLSEEFYQTESETCGADEVGEEIDDEFELPGSSASESEPEDEILVLEKTRMKNDFVDDEAEESDQEDDIENEDEETDEKAEIEDNDTYSDPSSVNLAQLLNEKSEASGESFQNTCSLGIGSGLSGLCSGAFPTQELNMEDLEKNERNYSKEEENETLGLFIQEDAIMDTFSSEGKSKSFDSDSDEEILSKRSKKKVKLTFSDDEDDDSASIGQNKENSTEEQDDNEDSDANNDDDEVSSKHDDVSDDEDEIELKTAEYDEEEDEEAFLKNPSKAAKHFFEDEAELSGSDDGSGDEDEAHLDKYEAEQGDRDVFNQRKVQTELEKLHMKNMLDDDKREIRILQELLLEDGELHSDGPKRQRQFKWYTRDENALQHSYIENDDGDPKEGPEEEEDESWRKTRMDRENFLREIQNDDDADFNQLNTITKLEHKIVRPSPKISTPKTSNISLKSPNPMKNFTLITKRGSFLSRGEKVLSKLAEITNVGSENPGANTKSARNMVFTTISPEKSSEPIKQIPKRKCLDQPMTASKRLKFTPGDLSKPRLSVFDKLKLNETL